MRAHQNFDESVTITLDGEWAVESRRTRAGAEARVQIPDTVGLWEQLTDLLREQHGAHLRRYLGADEAVGQHPGPATDADPVAGVVEARREPTPEEFGRRLQGYTSHGHAVDGVPQVGRPERVARCGGPGLCRQCGPEAVRIRAEWRGARKSPGEPEPVVTPGPGRDWVRLELLMSREQATTFLEDWKLDPTAPILTGGSQENDVQVWGVVVHAD